METRYSKNGLTQKKVLVLSNAKTEDDVFVKHFSAIPRRRIQMFFRERRTSSNFRR